MVSPSDERGAVADKLEGCFFFPPPFISVQSCKWRNDPAAGPDLPLAACVQANMNRWVRIRKMRRAAWMCHPAETRESLNPAV